MARLRRAALTCASGVMLLAAGVLPGATFGGLAHADDLRNQQAQINDAIAQTSEDFANANAAVRAAAASAARVAVLLPGAQSRLAVAQGQLITAQAEQDAITARLEAAQASLGAVTQKVDAAEAVLTAKRAMIGAIARAAYSGGKLAEIGAVLSSNGPSDLVERVGLIHEMFAGTNRVLADVANARAELASQQANLQATTVQIGQLQAQSAANLASVQKIYASAAAAERDVATLVAQRKAALAATVATRAQIERLYQRLLAKQREVAAQLAARGNTSGPGIPGKGGLIWPMNGTKTSPFGYRNDPFTGQRKFHAGQDIAAASGTPIWAAQTGVVVFTETPGESGGYGNYTCIDHGGGFATCYAHQSAFAVHAGEQVTRGQVIGYEGTTGNSTGPHLHFETRVNGNPVDPMQYY